MKTVQDDFIPMQIQKVKQKSDKTFLAIQADMNLPFTFEKGAELFIDRNQFKQWDLDIEKTDYTGWKVLNGENKIVGTVEKYLTVSNNSMISVTCGNKNILIPLNGGFIMLFDKKNMQIKIERLEDLNIN